MHPVAQKELEENREAITAICRRYNVIRLWVFGSATGEEFDPSRSDFDFIAQYGERPSDISPLDGIVGPPEDFAEALGRPVDVIDARGVERKNEFFRRGVELSKKEIYAAEDGLVPR